MQIPSSNTNTLHRLKRSSGFTLIELMVVVAVVGVMAAFAVPSYYRAVEQSRVDIAGANLRAIWAAERLYWLENQTYTSDLAVLQNLGLLDAKILTADPTAGSSSYWNNYFYYQIPTASSATFTAKAVAASYTTSTSTLEINQDGELSGDLTPTNSTRKIVPIDFW